MTNIFEEEQAPPPDNDFNFEHIGTPYEPLQDYSTVQFPLIIRYSTESPNIGCGPISLPMLGEGVQLYSSHGVIGQIRKPSFPPNKRCAYGEILYQNTEHMASPDAVCLAWMYVYHGSMPTLRLPHGPVVGGENIAFASAYNPKHKRYVPHIMFFPGLESPVDFTLDNPFIQDK